jgi:hypothetical protein
LDWAGELAGDCRVDELPELLEELDDELDELDEPDEAVPDEPVPDELPDEPDEPDELDELLPDDVPESLTEAWVAPGRTTSTAPATATLAKDAVTVAAVSRRLPRSRSATARASCRASARPAARARRVLSPAAS